jgi:hypothetical protein
VRSQLRELNGVRMNGYRVLHGVLNCL